ncbi:biotin--[acetyl-CoA-carboxylase] ligase [Pseudohoeflea suaedae]|uniref:biotin--[acetyl-CoA-carboxylase] ligase n=1 Tax=Pseudohoeflea suaedae TaxID=877384 RepID=UPI001FCEE00A|nr:biotin--[acetyl-CoA-carboxylase] ligase [Pseudohoeflea suaedae]
MSGSSAKTIAFRHLPLGDVGSTNAELLERARKGEEAGLWITADRQLSGRGRRGRTWTSEPGNLYSSLLLIDPAEPHLLGSLPLAVAIAVHDAIAAVLPGEGRRLAIKWPNDVLIDGAKTSGILIESEFLPDSRQAVVIGCGVNIAHHPNAGGYASTCLHECGAGISPDEFFAHLFMAMEHTLDIWDAGRGIATIRDRWIERATGIGGQIAVRLPDSEIHGLFAGIDGDGRLLLTLPDGGHRTFAAGDVFFPAVSAAPNQIQDNA